MLCTIKTCVEILVEEFYPWRPYKVSAQETQNQIQYQPEVYTCMMLQRFGYNLGTLLGYGILLGTTHAGLAQRSQHAIELYCITTTVIP